MPHLIYHNWTAGVEVSTGVMIRETK